MRGSSLFRADFATFDDRRRRNFEDQAFLGFG
jgi:hypothetical protein